MQEMSPQEIVKYIHEDCNRKFSLIIPFLVDPPKAELLARYLSEQIPFEEYNKRMADLLKASSSAASSPVASSSVASSSVASSSVSSSSVSSSSAVNESVTLNLQGVQSSRKTAKSSSANRKRTSILQKDCSPFDFVDSQTLKPHSPNKRKKTVEPNNFTFKLPPVTAETTYEEVHILIFDPRKYPNNRELLRRLCEQECSQEECRKIPSNATVKDYRDVLYYEMKRRINQCREKEKNTTTTSEV